MLNMQLHGSLSMKFTTEARANGSIVTALFSALDLPLRYD